MSIQINQHVLLTVSTELTPVLFYPILYSFILKCFLGSKQTEVHCRICIFFSVLKIATFFLWRHLNLYFQLSIPHVLNCYFLDEESPASCWKAAQPFIKNLKFHWDEEKRQLMTVCNVSKVQQMDRSPKTQSCQQSSDLCTSTSSWCNPNQTVLPGEGSSWVVGNVNPLRQKVELNKGSPHSKWVFNPLTKTKCSFIGDFLVFVLLFLHNFLISNFLGAIVLLEAIWILMLSLSTSWSIFPPLCTKGVTLSQIFRLLTKAVTI